VPYGYGPGLNRNPAATDGKQLNKCRGNDTGPEFKVGIDGEQVTNAGVFEITSSGREAQLLTIGLLIRDVSHTLGNIDFEYNVAIRNLEVSRSSSDQRRYIRERLVAQHRERREPYMMLLK
jgi:hypothetical protein